MQAPRNLKNFVVHVFTKNVLGFTIQNFLSPVVWLYGFFVADVGGFFNNPDVDLLVRWYQAGAFYPFFRAHAHEYTKRREPYLCDADKMAVIRDAIRMRYELLPLWYTVFKESSVNGMPIVR